MVMPITAATGAHGHYRRAARDRGVAFERRLRPAVTLAYLGRNYVTQHACNSTGDGMLRGLNPLLTPDLLHALASMGHGDTIAVVDGNFPAVATARRLVVLPGADAPAVLDAILTLLPVDDFEPDPIAVMQVVGDADAMPEPVRNFGAVLARHGAPPPIAIERHAFYRAAATCFTIVQTGERRFYGNILLRKGVIPPP
jgi:L-fucose mutarotase